MTISRPLRDTFSADEKSKFQKDPIAYLSEMGMSLSDDAKSQLESNVKAQKAEAPDWGNFVQVSSKDTL